MLIWKNRPVKYKSKILVTKNNIITQLCDSHNPVMFWQKIGFISFLLEKNASNTNTLFLSSQPSIITVSKSKMLPEVQQKYWQLPVHKCRDSEQLSRTLEYAVTPLQASTPLHLVCRHQLYHLAISHSSPSRTKIGQPVHLLTTLHLLSRTQVNTQELVINRMVY